jgi:hypothetical protein
VYTASAFREAVVRWIVCEDQPFTVLENSRSQRLFRMLRPDIPIISSDTIHSDIMSMYQRRHDNLKQMLQVSDICDGGGTGSLVLRSSSIMFIRRGIAT